MGCARGLEEQTCGGRKPTRISLRLGWPASTSSQSRQAVISRTKEGATCLLARATMYRCEQFYTVSLESRDKGHLTSLDGEPRPGQEACQPPGAIRYPQAGLLCSSSVAQPLPRCNQDPPNQWQDANLGDLEKFLWSQVVSENFHPQFPIKNPASGDAQPY